MPWAAPRHCAAGHPPYTGRRCPACVKAHEQKRGSAAKRGYDADWRAFREDYLRRYPACCVPGCSLPATDVDHIVPLRQGGLRFAPGNLRPMCHAHHSARTGRDRARGG